MIIVLEGLNKVGKSALARLLSDKTGIPIIKLFNREKPDGLYGLKQDLLEYGIVANDFYEDVLALETINQLGSTHAILDRSIISASVYRKYDIPWGIWNYWFTIFSQLEGRYIWIDGEYDFYLQRCEEAGEERKHTSEEWSRLRNRYHAYFHSISGSTKEMDRIFRLMNGNQIRLSSLFGELCERLGVVDK